MKYFALVFATFAVYWLAAAAVNKEHRPNRLLRMLLEDHSRLFLSGLVGAAAVFVLAFAPTRHVDALHQYEQLAAVMVLVGFGMSVVAVVLSVLRAIRSNRT